MGSALILATGLIHLLLIPEHFEEAPYLGVLFAANFVGSAAGAFGVYRGKRWGWVLGILIALGALVAYAVSGTLGLPGVARGDLLEPVGIFTKAVEALFLVLAVCKFTGFGRQRRWVVLASGVSVVLLVSGLTSGLAMALEQQTGGHAGHGQQQEREASSKKSGLPVHLSATSPAIHEGDRYSLLVTNNSEKQQKAKVRTVVMDHKTHTNTPVIDEPLTLAAGEERELTATNDYGTANHFQTNVGSQTKALGLLVKVTDSKGNETARFNQDAFMS